MKIESRHLNNNIWEEKSRGVLHFLEKRRRFLSIALSIMGFSSKDDPCTKAWRRRNRAIHTASRSSTDESRHGDFNARKRDSLDGKSIDAMCPHCVYIGVPVPRKHCSSSLSVCRTASGGGYLSCWRKFLLWRSVRLDIRNA